ncbi:carboxypeptidase regulatory-like domain-containing protein [Peribacillus sp. JNUCC 23]
MSKNSNLRKFLTGAASVALVASAVAPAASASSTFPDVDANDTHASNIEKAVKLGLIKGKDGMFMPYNDITRGQVAIIIARYLGDVDTTGTKQFTDVSAKENAELAESALVVRAAGVFNGSNGAFNPYKSITRQEMASVLVRLFGLEDLADKTSAVTDNATAWEVHRENINILSENGITNVAQFNPLNNINRAQFASFMIRAIENAETISSGVAGFVFDAGVPVVGAKVTVGGKTAITNAKGYYKLLNVQPGTQKVTIQAKGFETVTASDVKVLEEQVSTFNKDIVDAKIDTSKIEVSGMVIDSETGAAVDKASVTVEKYNDKTGTWEAVASASTKLGAYSIGQSDADPDLILGTEYRQTVSKVGFKDFVQTITLDDQKVVNTLKGIKLDAIAAMDIAGTVTDASGAKMKNANVSIYDVNGVKVGSDKTDANGLYSVAGVKLVGGTYNVVVDHASSAVSYTEFNVVEGTNATHNVKLEKGNTIAATIGTESLSDVFGANATDADTAEYTLELLSGKTVIATKTVAGVEGNNDAALAFSFDRIAPGSYTVKLSGDYVVAKEFAITVDGNETFEGRAMPAGALSGVVNDGTIGIKGSEVKLVNASGNIVATVTTDASGEYSFTGIPAGDYTVSASADTFIENSLASKVAISKNQNTDTILSLEKVVTTGNVSGFARLSGSLSAAKNATVTYYDQDGEEVANATVTVTGSYSLSGLKAGTYDVVVRGAGIETLKTTQTIEAGKNLTKANYNLTSGGNASLKISVVDSKGQPVNVASKGFDLTDAYVDPTSPEYGVWEEASSTTDSVTIKNLSAGTYNLTVDVASDKFVDVKTTATLATGEAGKLVIVVDEVAAQSKVNFRVVDKSNANVDGAYVVVFNEDGSMKDVFTTTNGTAELALVDGKYTLAVYHNGNVVAARELTVAGKDLTVPVIQLSPLQ